MVQYVRHGSAACKGKRALAAFADTIETEAFRRREVRS
jgi:hypothetical protein